MKNPARKKSVQSGDFRRKHAVVHVSAIMHFQDTGVLIFGGYVLSGHCSRQQISGKNEGYLFSEGYLFTGFYGNTNKAVTRLEATCGILNLCKSYTLAVATVSFAEC